jgi:arylsulfatase A-like enzyme
VQAICLAAAPWLVALAACGADRAPFARDPVLVVVVDSLASAHVSCYGHSRPTTPNVDALAARGARFTTCYAQASWTLPSVASLFTGLEQELHGLRERDGALSPAPTTLAELFRAAGYRTHGIVQTPILRSRTGLGRGFDTYRVLDFSHDSSERAVDTVLDLFRQAGARPPFVYLHLAPPHMPYQPPAPFRGRFSHAADGRSDGSIENCRRVHREGLAPDHPDVVSLAAMYDENVAFADDLVGRLVREIEALPGAHRTLLVFASDHGEAFMQHGAQGHCTTVNEEMVRVPLFLAALDGRIPPRAIDGAVSLLDLTPTLAALCGLGAPRQRFSGVSLARTVLAAEPAPDRERPLFLSSRYRPGERDLELAAREGAYKLVVRPNEGISALFDLRNDPHERTDISAREPLVAERLRASIEAFFRARVASARAIPSSPASASASELAEIGYAGDE